MGAAGLHPVHVGCSGWNYRSWLGEFYPPGTPSPRWLELYAKHFGTVEVNSTFYRLASPNGVVRWVKQTPTQFCFAVKASRYLTHVKRLDYPSESLRRFYEPIAPLQDAGKLGPVLWQLPENFHRDDERLSNTLRELPTGRHAFEFRHPSWFTREVYELLREHRVALVLGDHPERPFQTHEATTSWRYLRMHHGSRGRRGNYSESELEEWGQRIDAWRAEGELFVYFNNDWEAFAPRNARWLDERLRDLAGEAVRDAA